MVTAFRLPTSRLEHLQLRSRQQRASRNSFFAFNNDRYSAYATWRHSTRAVHLHTPHCRLPASVCHRNALHPALFLGLGTAYCRGLCRRSAQVVDVNIGPLGNGYFLRHDLGATSFLASAIISYSSCVDRSPSRRRYGLSILLRRRLCGLASHARTVGPPIRDRSLIRRHLHLHLHLDRDMQDMLAFTHACTTFFHIHLLCRPRYKPQYPGLPVGYKLFAYTPSPIARWAASHSIRLTASVSRWSALVFLHFFGIPCIYPWWIGWLA